MEIRQPDDSQPTGYCLVLCDGKTGQAGTTDEAVKFLTMDRVDKLLRAAVPLDTPEDWGRAWVKTQVEGIGHVSVSADAIVSFFRKLTGRPIRVVEVEDGDNVDLDAALDALSAGN